MGKGIIYLRSDTVTIPTPQMLELILTDDVGDDVFGKIIYFKNNRYFIYL